MKNNVEYGYILKTLISEAGQRRVARFTCAECNDILDIAYHGTKSPTFFVARAVRQGWAAHETRKSKCYCPRCLQPLHKIEKGPVMTVVTPISPSRQPSSNDRMMIRSALDKSFDDSKGEYLDGMSDEKIASHLNFPRAWVTSLREAAYGPIRIDPEVTALRKSLAELEGKLDDLRQRIDALARKAA